MTAAKSDWTTRLCAACENRTVRSSRAKYCELCANADKHRHRARKAKVGHILVGVDCESAMFNVLGQMLNRMVTMSFARNDGSADSLRSRPGEYLDPADVYEFMRDNLAGHYTDISGQEYRQHLYGFHFNHDIGMLLHGQWDGLRLVHKATARVRGLLCGRNHPEGEECERLHYYNDDDCREILRNGGESDYIAWDAISKYGFATAAGRRFYMEYRPYGDRFEENERIDIHDVGSAFPGRFEQVIDKWQPPMRDGDRDIIKWGKAQRATDNVFATEDRNKIAAYSEAECYSLAKLIEKFFATLKDSIGFVMDPERLFGSGSVAGQVMKFFGVTKRDNLHLGERKVVTHTIDEIAQLSYYGGKIEAPAIGLFDQDGHARDINSAYPSKMIHLPCMHRGHGQWVDTARYVNEPNINVGYVLASWDLSDLVAAGETHTMPFMVRNRHSNVFGPQIGVRHWVSLPEYRTAVARYPDNITVHRYLRWTNTCACTEPMAFLSDVYRMRKEAKRKANDDTLTDEQRQYYVACEEVLKLIINSCYGKLAERKPKWGVFTNLHWAAMITGATRAQVNEECWSGEDMGNTPVYIHTDSVTFVGQERPSEGKELGAWGAEPTKRGMFIIQPGLSVSTIEGKHATRGVSKAVIVPYAKAWAEDHRQMFSKHPATWDTMSPMETRMMTLRQAHHLGKPHFAGTFISKPQKVGFRSAKREFDKAQPFGPDNPLAWVIPPKYLLLPEDVARLEDLESYKILLREQELQGLWDHDEI